MEDVVETFGVGVDSLGGGEGRRLHSPGVEDAVAGDAEELNVGFGGGLWRGDWGCGGVGGEPAVRDETVGGNETVSE